MPCCSQSHGSNSAWNPHLWCTDCTDPCSTSRCDLGRSFSLHDFTEYLRVLRKACRHPQMADDHVETSLTPEVDSEVLLSPTTLQFLLLSLFPTLSSSVFTPVMSAPTVTFLSIGHPALVPVMPPGFGSFPASLDAIMFPPSMAQMVLIGPFGDCSAHSFPPLPFQLFTTSAPSRISTVDQHASGAPGFHFSAVSASCTSSKYFLVPITYDYFMSVPCSLEGALGFLTTLPSPLIPSTVIAIIPRFSAI